MSNNKIELIFEDTKDSAVLLFDGNTIGLGSQRNKTMIIYNTREHLVGHLQLDETELDDVCHSMLDIETYLWQQGFAYTYAPLSESDIAFLNGEDDA